MFEQTTPQSNCCLESLRVLFLGLSACLAEWSREMRGKVSQVCQKWSFLFFLYSCGHMLQWWVCSGSLIQLLSSCLITDWTWSCSEVDKNHIWLKVHMKLYIWWPQEQQCSKTPAASPSCSSTLTIFSSEVRSRPARDVGERAHRPARFHYARQEPSLPAKQPKPFQPVIWPACGADIGTHLHSKSSHLRCASLPTVLFSVVCLSLCLFVRCCI